MRLVIAPYHRFEVIDSEVRKKCIRVGIMIDCKNDYENRMFSKNNKMWTPTPYYFNCTNILITIKRKKEYVAMQSSLPFFY